MLNSQIVLEATYQSNPVLLYTLGKTDTKATAGYKGHVGVRESTFMQKLCEIQQKKLRRLRGERVSTGEPRTLNTMIIPEVISQSNAILLYSMGKTETKVTAGYKGHVERKN